MKALHSIILLAVTGGFSIAAQAGGDPAKGKEIAAQCQACHGMDGNSTDPQYPRLAGQHADYMTRALSDYKTGARENAIMKGFATNLSRQDMKDVSAWFASQTGLVSTRLSKTVKD